MSNVREWNNPEYNIRVNTKANYLHTLQLESLKESICGDRRSSSAYKKFLCIKKSVNEVGDDLISNIKFNST